MYPHLLKLHNEAPPCSKLVSLAIFGKQLLLSFDKVKVTAPCDMYKHAVV